MTSNAIGLLIIFGFYGFILLGLLALAGYAGRQKPDSALHGCLCCGTPLAEDRALCDACANGK